jgi:3-methyladenine DNA glycosylase/8-oxoguanine DNA glycosylase
MSADPAADPAADLATGTAIIDEATGDVVLELAVEGPLDLVATLGPLSRGPRDPTIRLARHSVARAARTPDGPGSIVVDLDVEGGRARVRAWGPGARWLADGAAGFIGLDDDPSGFDPALHPVVARLARRRSGLRLGRTGLVMDHLLQAVVEQKITGSEAFSGWRRLVITYGEPAPGPTGLHLPPTPERVAALPSWTWPQLGIEPRRGALLRRLATDGSRLQRLAIPAHATGAGGAGAPELAARLRSYPGIGPWTAAEVTLRALGDPDAVSVADAHLSHVVAWNLAREPRGTDERMLELLVPWAGHRARVIRLLELDGSPYPRYGPRVAPRDLREMTPADDRRRR